ncbi:MAG: hypothetical protein GMKNLPBB_01149 [Myxococcota bacterium]|nr:hypothetical protein [Myxococcota bacterium]
MIPQSRKTTIYLLMALFVLAIAACTASQKEYAISRPEERRAGAQTTSPGAAPEPAAPPPSARAGADEELPAAMARPSPAAQTESPARERENKRDKMKDEITLGGARTAPKAGPLKMFESPPMAPAIQLPAEFNTESYSHINDNDFQQAASNPLSTFSIDVDTASYSNVRRFLNEGRLPPRDAVRVEELINYFSYQFPQPDGSEPFSVITEVSSCPWNADHRLLMVGLQGKTLAPENIPPRNLTFLLDVSGSMMPPDRLPLVRNAMALLVNQLTEKDHVSIVVYAGASGLVLPPTSGARKHDILEALNRLQAGGSTNGAGGIQLAYEVARQHFNRAGINRVILATDGDFNVGAADEGSLVRMIEQERESGVFLTVLGVGRGNLKDSMMEKLADKGNGQFAYLDSLDEARKALAAQAGSSLVTIAKDVKIQIEFNPAKIAGYRLIGYENRMLAARDFNDDRKDAGEIGAGHAVVALYELVPAGAPVQPDTDPLKYQKPGSPTGAVHANELLTLKLRYKQPDGGSSKLLSRTVTDVNQAWESAPENLRFAAAVASFGMVLRASPHKGGVTLDQVRAWADRARTHDPEGYRAEFVRMVSLAQAIAPADQKEIAR